jgi:hypothetical protein
MMLHLLLVLPLLLLVVGINAELLHGTSHEHTEKRNLGTCLCTILCQRCELQGSDMAQCQTSCAYSKEPDCSDLCDDFIKGIGNRDDTYAPPPLPAEPLTQSPTCYCATLCESCKAKGSNTASCRTVCRTSVFMTL